MLKDVSARRTRLEEHEESGSVSRWKATVLGVCLNGRLIQVLCTPFADADWAGDRQSRKSVSGLHDLAREAPDQGMDEAAKHCGHQHRRSRTVRWQPCRNTESMGVHAFAKDLGRVVTVRLHIDSSAALSIIGRTGLGKTKHIEIQHLWLQEAVREAHCGEAVWR